MGLAHKRMLICLYLNTLICAYAYICTDAYLNFCATFDQIGANVWIGTFALLSAI